ncbi:uncharacterized protein LOC119668804 [Teleopsis dalmanni]|uniref:uncharacterized protein LOC119668804 n=1 Tax=Teleopsis dalmanni TaxID=139649 RepID=UPI0018CDD6D4|nr:uncharacterized protein LOC119668804 [Teleopsis dalmanni]XP_037934375.1 uncharacterized protein LOC119668804 [Teleopsis dalmanni]
MAQQLDRESAADADVFFSNYRGGLAVAYNFDPGTVDFFELRNGSNIIWAVEEDDKIVISNVAYLKNKNFFDSLNKDIAFRENPLSLNEPTLARTHAQYFPYVHLLHIAKRLSKLTDIQINRMKKVYTDQGYEHTDVHNNFIMAHLMHLNKSFVAAYEEYADSFLGKNIKVRLSDVKRSESQPQGAKLYKTQESFEFAMLLAIHACGKSYHATNYST